MFANKKIYLRLLINRQLVMKHITICTILLILSIASFSQSPILTKEDYLRKSKNQKTTAWIMLGGGNAMSVVGLSLFNFAGSADGEVNNTPATVLFFTGVAAMFGSIPFFHAAKKNRNKAISVSFENQPLPQLQKNSLAYKAIPSLSLKFSLRKRVIVCSVS
jgi:hypothetical protein